MRCSLIKDDLRVVIKVENLRSLIDGLQWIGLELDEELNRSHTGGREGLISREGSRPAVYVIPTDEELLIARDTVRCVLKEPQHS